MTIVDPGARVATRDAVTILAWPEEADRAAALERRGTARLLLVAADADPPEDRDGMTDWVRLPVSHRDLMVRVDALRRRSGATESPAPVVDQQDVLWRGDRWVALSPIEADILRVLLDHGARVASRHDIGARVWPGGMPTGRPIDGRLPQLRVRIAPLGLRIHSIRRRGLLLTVDDDVTDGPGTGAGGGWTGD